MMPIDIEVIRRKTSSSLNDGVRSRLGQYFTPQRIALFMASLFDINNHKNTVSLLDAGAGIGSLTAAFIETLCQNNDLKHLNVTAFEIDEHIASVLERTLQSYQSSGVESGLFLDFNIITADFIPKSVQELGSGTTSSFDYAILNPPYYKINRQSEHRKLLRQVGIETVNLYSAFVALALKQLKSQGQLVAIIPRSFCNGPYYKTFRKQLVSEAAIKHIHLFRARDKAFGEDDVLQENIIIHIQKGVTQSDVTISTSDDGRFNNHQEWSVSFDQVVKPEDRDHFIHVPYQSGPSVLNASPKITAALTDIGCMVSTGPVVDFRVKSFLRKMPDTNTAPLIYPAHFNGWTITHPLKDFKKYNAIELNDITARQLYPTGFYVLIRRFSSKEEKRRIVARVIQPADVNGDVIGFENHLNVIHYNKKGLPEDLAFGLAAYLNSFQVDEYFRVFSGHTQVNATDLKRLRYPNRNTLTQLGQWAKNHPSLEDVDKKISTIL